MGCLLSFLSTGVKNEKTLEKENAFEKEEPPHDSLGNRHSGPAVWAVDLRGKASILKEEMDVVRTEYKTSEHVT